MLDNWKQKWLFFLIVHVKPLTKIYWHSTKAILKSAHASLFSSMLSKFELIISPLDFRSPFSLPFTPSHQPQPTWPWALQLWNKFHHLLYPFKKAYWGGKEGCNRKSGTSPQNYRLKSTSVFVYALQSTTPNIHQKSTQVFLVQVNEMRRKKLRLCI